jgi:hypothetical protein
MARQIFSLQIDDSAVKRNFSQTLEAQVKAASATLDTLAGLTRRNYIKNAQSDLTMRNTFTRRQMQFEKVQTRILERMQSEVGTTEKAPWMEIQEEGGARRPKKGGRLAIPQRAARGGSNRNVVRRDKYISRVSRKSIKGPFRRSITSKKSRLVAMAYMAERLGKTIRRGDNIYAVQNFNKAGGSPIFKLIHLYNTSKVQTRVKGNPMLIPATRAPIRDAQRIYNSKAQKLMRNLK